MMDRFEAMTMLIEVVECGSLSGASRSLGVPLPTLSRKISDLEALLGTKLLIRTTRSLTLTDTGATYLSAARRILEDVQEAEREAAGELMRPKGELVVAAPVMFGRLHVLPIVTEFLALYPQIDIRLLLSDRNVQLVDDHVDMAVRIGALADSAMIATRVGSVRTVICGSPRLLEEHGVPQVPADVARLPCIANDTPTPSPGWTFTTDGLSAPVRMAGRPRLSLTTTEAAADAAKRHVGLVRLLHYQVVDAVEEGLLRIVLEQYEPEPAPIHVLHVARGQMPLKMRRFLDFAVPLLRKRLERFAEPQD